MKRSKKLLAGAGLIVSLGVLTSCSGPVTTVYAPPPTDKEVTMTPTCEGYGPMPTDIEVTQTPVAVVYGPPPTSVQTKTPTPTPPPDPAPENH